MHILICIDHEALKETKSGQQGFIIFLRDNLPVLQEGFVSSCVYRGQSWLARVVVETSKLKAQRENILCYYMSRVRGAEYFVCVDHKEDRAAQYTLFIRLNYLL